MSLSCLSVPDSQQHCKRWCFFWLLNTVGKKHRKRKKVRKRRKKKVRIRWKEEAEIKRAWWQALKFTSFLMFLKITKPKRDLRYAGICWVQNVSQRKDNEWLWVGITAKDYHSPASILSISMTLQISQKYDDHCLTQQLWIISSAAVLARWSLLSHSPFWRCMILMEFVDMCIWINLVFL